jgi:hypothetical protein
MKKIYKLTATRINKDISNNYTFEECYFTSKNKAYKSMDYLKNHLINKHKYLNKSNIQKYNTFNSIETYIIDDKFNVSLIEHNIKTLTLKYI